VQTKEKTTIYSFAEFKLIPSEKLFFRGDSPIHLRAKTFSLLLYLVESENRLCEKENLIKEIWGDTIVEEGNLNRTISELRKTLGDNSTKPKFIETVPLGGYRFIAEVEKTFKSVEPVEVKELSKENLQPATKPQSFKKLIYAGIALLIFSVIALSIWKFSAGKEQIKSNKSGLIQLTSDALDENTPQWTTDGKIRYRLNKKDRITDWMKINAD
jgi:DNA-binding winged helix-turn-helix (wHTH) protein